MIELLEHLIKNEAVQIDPNRASLISFYDEHQEIRAFKPGEYVSRKDVHRYKIPAKFFINPECLRLQGAFKFAHEKKGKFTVGVIRTYKGAGDVLISSVIAKALKFTYKDNVKVWFCVKPEHACLLENNPHIDRVFTDEKLMLEAKPDIKVDTNTIDFRVKLNDLKLQNKEIKNRTDIYLEELGLYVENKTPCYVVTEEEKEAAKKELKKLGYGSKKKIIGLQLKGSNLSRTYLHMDKVGDLLKQKYQIFYLDERDLEGNYKYGFREMAALINEMYMIITPNSFFYHLAGAMGKRGLVLFGSCDGSIWVEDYEKMTPVEIPCPYGKAKCWWRLECLKGGTLKEKENQGTPDCLKNITPKYIVQCMETHVKAKKVLVVALTYNFLPLTKDMVDSVRSFHDYDIFVIDNKSTDGTADWLKKRGVDFVCKKTTVAQAENIGMEKAYNEGYDYCLVCNNDIILSADYIDVLVEIAERRKSFMTTGQVITKNSKAMFAYKQLKDKQIERSIITMEAGDYSAILMSRECIRKIGKFDERFGPRYQEDEDHMLRVRLAGCEVIKTYSTSFLHMLGQVCKKNKNESIYHEDNWAKNIKRFKRKWGIDLYAERNQLKNLPNIKEKTPNWQKLIKIPITDKKIKFDADSNAMPIIIINEVIKDRGRANVAVVRRMGGAGDVLFISIIAKVLKEEFGNRVKIDYAIPFKYFSLLKENKDVNNVSKFQDFNGKKYDFVFHTTDYEYNQEMAQVLETGWIRKARTEMFIDMIGTYSNLKPDFFLTKKERKWGELQWAFAKKNKRIAIAVRGSNLMKEWTKFDSFIGLVQRKGHSVIIVDMMDGEDFKYDFREAGAIISACDAVVSPDTAFSNIAGCLDIPVVTIFPNRNGKIFEKMFFSMVAIQGVCPHFPDKNYCDYTVKCFPGPMDEYRKKEMISPPKCLEALSLGRVYGELERILEDKINGEMK